MAFRRGGFTLIEALVVIFVIGILVALIIPAVIAARQVSRRIECSNKLKEIGLAITGYVDDNKAFPIGVNGKSALARLLPYLGKEPLYNSMNFVAPPEGVVPRGANLTAHQTTVQAFICPSDREPVGYAGPCNYGGNVGVGYTHTGSGARNGLFSGTVIDPKITLAAVRDGMSHTAAVSEFCRNDDNVAQRRNKRSIIQLGIYNDFLEFTADCANANVTSANLSLRPRGESWLRDGFGRTLYNHNIGPNGNTCATGNDRKGAWTASSFHPGGVNLLYGDGHVSFIKDTIDIQTWRSKGSMDGGEINQPDG